jgi:hypothetical protein
VLFPRGRIRDRVAFRELREGLPFLDISIVGSRNFERMVTPVFASDRHRTPKGMIELVL